MFGSSDRRSSTRHAVQGVESSLGAVTDVSEQGLCVFVKGAVPVQVGESLTLEISGADESVQLNAEVVRIQPCGLWRYEVGLAYQSVFKEDRARLSRMVAASRVHGVSPKAYQKAK
ncbi:MAG: PilZ domain-containing protein [Planctomycetota bacterium]